MNTQIEAGKTPLPSYISFKTFLNFLIKLEQGVPHRIDRSFLNRYYSGAVGSQLITSLRFLGLVEGEDHRTTAALERLVQEQDARKQLLAQLLHERYQPVFTNVGDLSKATHLQIEQAFKQFYNVDGETRRKAISFFVHAAQHTEIPLSAYIRTTSNPGSNRTVNRAGAKQVKPRQNNTRTTTHHVATTAKIKDEDTSSTQAVNAKSTTKTVTLQSGGSVTLTYAVDLFDVDEQDRQFLLGLIDQIRDYEQAVSNGYLDDEEEIDDEEEA